MRASGSAKIQERVRVVDILAITAQQPLIVDHAVSVATAVEGMGRGNRGCVLVTREGKLVGIFTERDVLNKVLGEPGALTQPVSALMTPDPTCIAEADPIRKAAGLVHRGGFRNLPVVDAGGAPVGVVGHKDVIGYLVQHFVDRTLNLPPDPDQIATKAEGA